MRRHCAFAAPRARAAQRHRRRHRRQRGRSDPRRASRRAPSDAGAAARRLPRAGDHRLPAGGPAAQGALPAPTHAPASTGSPRDADGIVALVGFPERDDDVYNALAVLADGDGRRRIYRKMRLPNYGVFDESPLLPGRRRAGDHRGRRRHGRPDDLRGHLGARRRRVRRGARRRRADRQRLGLARTTPGKAAERETMLKQRARDNLVAFAFCAHGRRPGRAGLRRRTRVVSTTTGTVIARAPQFAEHLLIADVDAHAARGRPAARHAPAPAGARGAARVAGLGALRPPAAARRGDRARRRGRADCSTPTPRSTPRSCSARATTCARTASSTSSSACRAASTPRSWPLVAVDALGAERSPR